MIFLEYLWLHIIPLIWFVDCALENKNVEDFYIKCNQDDCFLCDSLCQRLEYRKKGKEQSYSEPFFIPLWTRYKDQFSLKYQNGRPIYYWKRRRMRQVPKCLRSPNYQQHKEIVKSDATKAESKSDDCDPTRSEAAEGVSDKEFDHRDLSDTSIKNWELFLKTPVEVFAIEDEKGRQQFIEKEYLN